MKNLFTRFAAALAMTLGALSTTPSHAQCALPDGLDSGPCCAPAGVNLPNFPLLTADAQFLCWDNCQLAQSKMYCTIIGKPKPLANAGAIVCGQYDIRIQLRDCGTGQLAWAGAVRASYSRNWQESSVPGAVNLTVWRFLINGDFKASAAAGTTLCDRPACLSTYSRIYFSGHIDYALDCTTGQWAAAWALNHECDAIHHPLGSLRPAPATGLHPDKSFTMVGPGTGFVPSSTLPIVSNGPIVQGGFRWNNWAAAPMVCTYRESASGQVAPMSQFCMCPSATPAIPQYVDTFLGAQGMCGSSLNNVDGARFVQKQLGNWTAASGFPGNELLLFDYGDLAWANG